MCEKKTLKSKLWLVVVACAAILFSVAFAFFWNQKEEHTPGGHPMLMSVRSDYSHPMVIPVAMAADDNYTYPTIVAITSMMTNSNSNAL